jgi:hypothetical protein
LRAQSKPDGSTGYPAATILLGESGLLAFACRTMKLETLTQRYTQEAAL